MTLLRSYQEEAVDFGLRLKTWGLFAEMGLGKTLIALTWIIRSKLRKVAIICRRDDLLTWEDEIQTHTSLTFINVAGTKRKKNRLEALRGKARLYLLTYDSVKQLRRRLMSLPWDGAVCDESTEIKHHTSQKTKQLIAVFGKVPNRLAMTGTPITNSPLDAFSQMLFIDRGAALGTSWWKFRARYYWPSPTGYEWFPYKGAYQEIRKRIYGTCIRFRKEECLDLPPKVYVQKPCGMHPEQRKLYSQIVEDYEMTLQSGETLELDYAVQKFVKLLQITGGFYYTEDGPVDLPCGKLDTLRDLLDLPEFRRTKKIVLWANFNHEIRLIRRLAKSLGYRGVSFWKHTKDRVAVRKRFRDDPDCQLWIGQVRSGIGMNELKVSDTVLYYSRSLRLVNRLQSEDRTHRLGSEIHERIRYIDLIVPHTVDARVYSLLRKARDVASLIVDGAKALSLMKSTEHTSV